jgi:hypothetical protein
VDQWSDYLNMTKKLHRLAAWTAGIPLLIISTTGVLLQVKSWVPWIQPPQKKGSATPPSINLNTLLKTAQSVPEAGVHKWNDIRTIDIKPSSGVANLRTRSDYEISVDLGTGKVLQAAPRRTSLLIQIHEGSYFGESIRYGVFLPAAILLVILWITGIFLLIRPWIIRNKRRLIFPKTVKH